MERINLAVVVAALVVLVMSAVKPEARLGDYQLVFSPSGTTPWVIDTDTGETWGLLATKGEWKAFGTPDK